MKNAYRMPAEFEKHDGCIIIYPFRAGSWGRDAAPARRAFSQVISAIAKSERVYLICNEHNLSYAKGERFPENVEILSVLTDDSWARDIAPTFVKNSDGDVKAVNWSFNAWGGEYNGLYSNWQKDDEFAKTIAKILNYSVIDASPFVLEGGSIHSDGEGTVMVTESCLLSGGRNPHLKKIEIEEKLKSYLGAEKVLWLPRGIYNDETDEHVDNVCAFIRPAEVVLAWTEDKDDPQYALSLADLGYLESQTDAKGRRIKVHKLPVPDFPETISESDLDCYEFEDGEDKREAGERLAASYVNFYFSNGAVVMPVFGGKNAKSDERAVEILKKLCPEREIIAVSAREILKGGGNIHCITQQIPSKEI